MTKSTGLMELRKRRGELYRAELSLRRAMLHVMSAIAWACKRRDEIERRAQGDAYDILRVCYGLIVEEQGEVT